MASLPASRLSSKTVATIELCSLASPLCGRTYFMKNSTRPFPKMRTFQGGLSVGTVDDLLISLEYIEQVYGRKALPQVLGPRDIATICGESPGGTSIYVRRWSCYSPYYGVEETPSGPRLKPKASWQGWFSWLRFVVFKQQKRYLASFSALARNLSLWILWNPVRSLCRRDARCYVPWYGSLSKPYDKSPTQP